MVNVVANNNANTPHRRGGVGLDSKMGGLTTNKRKRKIMILIIILLVFVIYVCGFLCIFMMSSTNKNLFASSGSSTIARDTFDGLRKFRKQREQLQLNHVPNPSTTTTTKNPTIGYAVSITGCGSDPITEGAAVLKHSIHLSSVHGSGKYDYKMYAIYHPQAEKCAMELQDLGYILLKRETPVPVPEIQGEYLRTNIEKNGCCGEKELIKLEAYTLVEHPIIVHLDLDTLVLQPLDKLFDFMIHHNKNNDHPQQQPVPSPEDIQVMWPEVPTPPKVNAFFTRDYNMVQPGRKYKPVQGGFLVLRPDMDTYKEFVRIIREGDFQKGKGWGGIGGTYYGVMTFQGLIPYYYDILHPNEAIEVNRCVYNQMCDNPRDQKTVNDVVHGKCRVGTTDCEDCRNRPLEDIFTVHYTLCQKPWLCLSHDQDIIQQRLCRKIVHEWFRIRSDLEKSWGRSGYGSIVDDNQEQPIWEKEQFYGYCKSRGKYERIQKPYYPNNITIAEK